MQIKILTRLEKGRYEAEVNNRHIILKSNRELKSGKVFDGELSFQNGKILVKTDETAILEPAIEVMNFSAEGEILPSEILLFLENQNLPPDNLSFQIVLQFKQLGLKFDSDVIKQIRRISKKTENPVKTARRVTVLYQKGVNLSKIFEKPEMIYEDFYQSEQNQNNQDNENNQSELSVVSKEDCFELIRSFFKNIENFSEEIEIGNEIKIGKLSVLNHLGFKSGTYSNSWVVIPFEIVNNFDETVFGGGSFRFLLASSDKSVQKIIISFSFSQEDYRFLLDFKSNHIKKIKYAVKSGKKLNLPYEYVDFDKIETFASGTEQLSFAGGLA